MFFVAFFNAIFPRLMPHYKNFLLFITFEKFHASERFKYYLMFRVLGGIQHFLIFCWNRKTILQRKNETIKIAKQFLSFVFLWKTKHLNIIYKIVDRKEFRLY